MGVWGIGLEDEHEHEHEDEDERDGESFCGIHRLALYLYVGI
jgi:hypothetical protein